MNIFNATFDFATAWASLFKIANLASSLTFLQFGAFVFMWTRAENHSRRDILWQRKQYSKSKFRQLWEWFTHSPSELRKWHFL